MAIRPLLRRPGAFLEGWFIDKILSDDLTTFDELLLTLPVADDSVSRPSSVFKHTRETTYCKEEHDSVQLSPDKTCDKKNLNGSKFIQDDGTLYITTMDKRIILPFASSHPPRYIPSPGLNNPRHLADNKLKSPESLKCVHLKNETYHNTPSPSYRHIRPIRQNIRKVFRKREQPLPRDLLSLRLDKIPPEFKISEYLHDAVINGDREIKRLLFSMLAEKYEYDPCKIRRSLLEKQITHRPKQIRILNENTLKTIVCHVAFRQNFIKNEPQWGSADAAHSNPTEYSLSEYKQNSLSNGMSSNNSLSNKEDSEDDRCPARGNQIVFTEQIKNFSFEENTHLSKFNLRKSRNCDNEQTRSFGASAALTNTDSIGTTQLRLSTSPCIDVGLRTQTILKTAPDDLN